MSSSEFMMSYWLTQSNPMMLQSPSESTDEAEDDDGSEDADSGSQSGGSKDYDDDDFDNRSLEIDEEERHKISAQLNPDEEEENVTEEEEKEEIIEKEDSGQEKNQGESDAHAVATSGNDRVDDCDDGYKSQGHTTTAGLDNGETSMTESAESRTLESYGLIQKLESERKQLLQELNRDEQHRQYFYNKMKTITQKMESLQQSETNGVQLDISRRQLEMEAYQVQEAMHRKLGLQEACKLRQEACLDKVRHIEAEMISLQTQARKPSRDRRKDVTTMAAENSAVRIKAGQENAVDGCVLDKMEVSPIHSIALSTPTGDTTLMDIPDGVAPGIPLSANHLLPFHDSWSLQKESGGLYNSLSPSQDVTSLSFSSMNSSFSMGAKLGTSQTSTLSLTSDPGDPVQSSGTKVEMVYSLLSMLGTHDKEDMSRTLLAMSQSQENCIAMRQAGCLPLLLQVLHGSDKEDGLLGNTRGSKTARARASAALHNMVHCHHDDKRGRREARTLRLLEQIRAHCDQQRGDSDDQDEEADASGHSGMDHHPGAAIAALMKLSFDEDYRHAICTLGGLQAIAELLEIDNRALTPMNDYSTTIRRYSCMALTNLTFGDGKNKAMLCSVRSAMEALTDQLRSTNEDLIQAAASVLRNLSWRADLASKKTLREIGVVTTLMRAAMSVKKETTLKSILSALWNLSSHCSENKAEICAVDGALQFLVSLLTYKSTAKTLAIIENGGGILRNVSSHVAIREDYRQILRRLDCLKLLLCHLKSPSLTIVSNACGTLWNLSARCEEDQNVLRDMGAISMLRNLVHSRHKMISSGSSAALKNLLTSIPAGQSIDKERIDGSHRPSLHVRRQRAFEAELDHNLSETCENVDSPRNSPTEIVHRSESEPRRFVYHLNSGGNGNGQRQDEDTRKHMTRRQMMPRNGFENGRNFETSPSGRVARAGSQDSVGSTHSDISHDRTRSHTMLAKTSFLLHKRQGSSLEKRGFQPDTERNTSHHNQSFLPEYNTQADHMTLNSSSLIIVNDMPAHIFHPTQGNLHYQHNQGWQTMPHSQVSQHGHELANTPDSMHGSSSLTQSAPSHCQTFCQPDMINNRYHQQSLLERLAKSSSGLSGSCNLNNSITVTNNDLNSSIDYSNHLTLSIAADGDRDQPVNYSMKFQDGVIYDRSNKLSPSGHNNISFDPLSTTSPSADLLPGTLSESMKSSLMNSSMNERNCLMNNTIVQEKIPINNRQLTNPSGNKIILNSTMASHRPVPNLLHNRFHGPEGFQPTGIIQNQSPIVSNVANSPFNSLTYQYSCQSLQTSNQSLPPPTAAGDPGYAVNVRSTGSDQFSSVPTSQMHLVQSSNKNTKLESNKNTKHESEFLAENPTNMNLSCSEFTTVNSSKKCQDQPINYSINCCSDETEEDREIGSIYKVETFCDDRTNVDAKYINNFGTASFREGPHYQTTNTTFTSFPQTGRHDKERKEMCTDLRNDDCSSKRVDVRIGADLKTDGSKMVLGSAATLPGSQTAYGHSDMPSSIPGQDLHGFTKQQEKNLSLEETPMGCPEVSSVSIQDYKTTREKDFYSKGNWRKDQADEMPAATLRDSSSSESLSSSDIEPTVCPDMTKHCQITSEVTSTSEVADMPSSPGKKSSPAKKLKDFFTAPKSRNVVTKQSLQFDKSPSSIKPDTFISFAAFDEEDKPIHFAMKNQDLPLSQPFSRLEIGQPVGFSSFEIEQEQPHLTFSTFQKNFQPPNSNQSNHFTNRLCTPRAKTLPTLIEQTAETESSTIALETPACVGEKSLCNIMETTNQNVALTLDESKQINMQHGSENVILSNGEEKLFALKTSHSNVLAASCVTKDTPPRLLALLNQEELEPSESEESEEETTSPKKIYSSMPLEKSSADTIECSYSVTPTVKRSGIPMKKSPNGALKVPIKMSSIPKPTFKKTISSPATSGGNQSSSTTWQSVQQAGHDVSKNQHEGQLFTFKKSHEKQICTSENQHEKQLYTSENPHVKLLQSTENLHEKQLNKMKHDHHKADCDNDERNTDSEIAFLEDKSHVCDTFAPLHEFVLPDTARENYIEEEVTTSPDTEPDSDITIGSESPAADSVGMSRIPKTRLGFGFQGIDAKSGINQTAIKLCTQTHIEHTIPNNTNYTPQRHTNKTNCEASSRNEEMEFVSSESSSDSLHVFDVDGAPISFTTDDSPLSFVREERGSKGCVRRVTDQTCSQAIVDDYSSSTIREQYGAEESADENVDDTDSDVRERIFYIGDTTDCSSRTSSLHSLNKVDLIEQLETSSSNDLEVSQVNSVQDESCDINDCLSYDSPCGKFNGYGSSTGELTLVEQCITSPLHKSKLPRTCASRDTRTRIQGPTQEVDKYYISHGTTGSSSLNLSNEDNSSSETDHESQSSLSHDHSSDEHSTSQSCSDTPYLDLDLQIPPFFSRLSRCNTWCQQSKRCRDDKESIDYNEDYLNGGISPEETERLLMENVHLIMSEIQTNKMSSSSVDEDLFIENETISLVSNGYTSDTNSEVSVSWSVTSEKTSNLSAASLARKQNQVSASMRKCGPKFIKPEPGQSVLKNSTPEKDEIKTIRGRRKPLYPGKPANPAVTVKGNLKIVTPKSKAVNIPAVNKTVSQNGAAKLDINRSSLALKKTPPKIINVVTISAKTISAQPSSSKMKNPPQKIVHRRSRSAGPATSPGKNGAMQPSSCAGKTGSKGMATSKSAPQSSPPKFVKTLPRVGEVARGKLIAPTSSNVSAQTGSLPSDQCKPSTGNNGSPGHSKIPTGAHQSQSKIPSTNSGNKNTNNVTTTNIKKNNKPVGQTSRSTSSNAISSIATDRKTGQNTSNNVSNVSGNSSNRNSDSFIPRRKSSSSSTILNNTDSNKQTPLGSTCSNKRTSPVIAEPSKRTSPVSADSSKRTSPVAADVKKNTSSNISDSNKHASLGATNIHRRIPSNNTDINKFSSSNTPDSNKRSSLVSTDPAKRISPNNSDFNKRSSLGNTDPNKRSSLGNTDPNKRSSLGNTDQGKRSSLGNTDPAKRTSTAVVAKKQTSSKIATLWKKDGVLERSPSGGSQLPTTASSPSSKLPVFVTKSSPSNTKPSSLPRQVLKAKAATLPNSSLASSKARSFNDRISKSSTYEKISTELHGFGTKPGIRRVEAVKKTAEPIKVMKQVITNCNSDSSESDVRQICDTSDDDEDNNVSIKTDNVSHPITSTKTKSVNDPHDSLENVFAESSQPDSVRGTLSSSSNHGDSLEQIDDMGSHIDSRTFRKKKRDQYISDLDLPNADETCRSMSSLTDSHGSQHFSSMGMTSYKSSLNADSFIRKMSIIDILESEMSESSEKSKKNEDEKSENKSKSTVAQGLKRLFAGKQKDKERESKDKNKDLSKSRQYEKESKAKHSKSNSKHKKGGRSRREYDFFRSNIKIEPSTTWTDEDCLVYDLETSFVPPIRQISHRTDSINPASMAPVHNFSSQSGVYTQQFSNQSGVSTQQFSNQSMLNVQNFINQSVISVQNDEHLHETDDGDGSSSERHMTKTEMLLARRHRTNLSSSQLDLGHGEGAIKTTHAVTAV